jgi:hypothetical protein
MKVHVSANGATVAFELSCFHQRVLDKVQSWQVESPVLQHAGTLMVYPWLPLALFIK